MKRVVIVHGYTGYPDKNWFPWLKEKLEEIGVRAEVPEMPNTNAPKLSEWLPHLTEAIGNPDEELVLVGHSLGCPTILRYLESLDDDYKVGGVVLVAGFAEPLPHLPELNSFTENSWDDEKIKSKSKQITIVNSTDDDAVPFFNAETVRDRFGAKLVTLEGMGHINERWGITEVPFVLDEVEELLKTKQ